MYRKSQLKLKDEIGVIYLEVNWLRWCACSTVG